MSEMIERVARVIGEAYNGYCDPVDTPNTWATALSAARSVLEAMRHPTQEMANAGTRIGGDYDSGVSDIEAEVIWEDMIDEALK